MKIADSELIINGDGSAFHLHMKPEQLSDTVLLVGDRSRVNFFKELYDTLECETSSREFVSATGTYKGKRFTCLSTGIGIGNIDIVMNELDALANIDFSTREVRPQHRRLTVLRVGTCGGIQPDVPIGSYVFSEYSIGIDCIINWYAGRDKVSDEDIAKAFVEHTGISGKVGMPYVARASERLTELFRDRSIVGMTLSAPGFYGPQGRSIRIPLAHPDMLESFESFSYGGRRILNFEMEGSAIAALARHLGHDAGTICCVIANRYLQNSNTDYKDIVSGIVRMVLDTLSSEQLSDI